MGTMVGNHSLQKRKTLSTCSNTEVYCTRFNLTSARTDLPTAEMVEKSKIALNISVDYNCQEWLINRAVHLWETCSIKSVGQCVFQQIALVYFPWRLSPSPLPPCLISCPACLYWCVLVITPGVLSVSGFRVNTYDPWPLPSCPGWSSVNKKYVYQTSAVLGTLLFCLKCTHTHHRHK